MKKNTVNTKTIKLQIEAGGAKPSSSIGPTLGQHGINIVKFCKEFNLKTQEQSGLILPVIVTIYSNKQYSFIFKKPPTSTLIKKILGLKLQAKPGSGSKSPGKKIIALISMKQLEKIAYIKQEDLNTYDIDSSVKTIMGTVKSMGIGIIK